MNLTPLQKAVVDHRGGALIVSASAGSGKTEVLARRCAALVADPDHPCGVDQLLVVTFTRAAAAEMRSRISRELRRAAQAARPRSERARLRRAVVLADAADITTIDGWCGRLLRAHAVGLGIDPEFTMVTPEDAMILRGDELDGLLDALYAADEPLADDVRAWLRNSAAADDGFLRELILSMSAYREHVVNPSAWLATVDAAIERADAKPVLAAALAEECRFQHGELGRLAGEREARVLAGYRAGLGGWARELDTSPATLLDVVARIAETKTLATPRGTDPDDAAVLKRVRETWFEKRLKKPWNVADIANMVACTGRASGLMRTLRAIEQRFADRVARAKRQKATFEFADVQRLALDLLGEPAAGQRRSPTPLALRMRARYAHVLVDECQDTSPVQMELLRLVSRDAPAGGNWLMVGDIKQSIYGFREAEPALFAERVETLRADRARGDLLPLRDNFRTHGALLDALNAWFARLIERALGGTPFGPDERICAARAEIPNPDLETVPRVEISVLENAGAAQSHDDDLAGDVESIEREAQRAAERIRALLRRNTRIPERTHDGGLQLRPLQLGDIAILLRKARGHASAVARVLRANDLRCVAGGKETLLDTLEVGDVVNVLRLLVNRRHDVALGAYLRGPMVGLAPAELLEIRGAGGSREQDFLDAVLVFAAGQEERSAALRARVAAALEQLDRWTIVARESDVGTLVRRILRDSALPLFALGLRGGSQRVALLEALQSLAVAFDRPAAGVGEFVAQLDALEATEQFGSASTPTDDDAVRILTIHGAKGLEFPVVFLLGAGGRFNQSSGRRMLQCDASLGAGLKWFDAGEAQWIVSAERFAIARRATQRELEEELRLLYVAATRARELLYISGTAAAGTWARMEAGYRGTKTLPLVDRLGADNHLSWVLMAAASAGCDAGRVAVTAEPATSVDVLRFASPQANPASPLGDDDRAWVERGRRWLDTPARESRPRPAVLSVSALKRVAATTDEEPAVEAFTADWAERRLSEPGFVREAAADGRETGAAFHRVLQLSDVRRLGEPAAEIERLVAAGQLARAEAALVRQDDLAWLASGEIGQMLAAHADRLERELAFVWTATVEHGDHVIIRGVVDALIRTDAGPVLVDYKTDTVVDAADFERRSALYSRQLQIYGAAIESIRQCRVVRRVLAFVRARRIVDVPDDPHVLAAIGSAPAGRG